MGKYQTVQTRRVLHLNDCYSALSFLANVCDSEGIFRSKLKTLQLGRLSRSSLFFFLGLLHFNLPVKQRANPGTRIFGDASKGSNRYVSAAFLSPLKSLHWPWV